ncbi:DUF2007 domain-containing protein [Lagierella sp. ICN-221743]
MKLLLQSSNDFLTTTVKAILKDNMINYIDSEADLDGYLNIMGASVIKNESIFVDESDFERAYSLVQEFLDYKPEDNDIFE